VTRLSRSDFRHPGRADRAGKIIRAQEVTKKPKYKVIAADAPHEPEGKISKRVLPLPPPHRISRDDND
jgi:hypothetical protein